MKFIVFVITIVPIIFTILGVIVSLAEEDGTTATECHLGTMDTANKRELLSFFSVIVQPFLFEYLMKTINIKCAPEIILSFTTREHNLTSRSYSRLIRLNLNNKLTYYINATSQLGFCIHFDELMNVNWKISLFFCVCYKQSKRTFT